MIREGYRTIKNAAGTNLCKMYQKAGDVLKCAKTRLHNSALKESRVQFFATIDIKEVNQQLDLSLLDQSRDD